MKDDDYIDDSLSRMIPLVDMQNRKKSSIEPLTAAKFMQYSNSLLTTFRRDRNWDEDDVAERLNIVVEQLQNMIPKEPDGSIPKKYRSVLRHYTVTDILDYQSRKKEMPRLLFPILKLAMGLKSREYDKLIMAPDVFVGGLSLPISTAQEETIADVLKRPASKEVAPAPKSEPAKPAAVKRIKIPNSPKRLFSAEEIEPHRAAIRKYFQKFLNEDGTIQISRLARASKTTTVGIAFFMGRSDISDAVRIALINNAEEGLMAYVRNQRPEDDGMLNDIKRDIGRLRDFVGLEPCPTKTFPPDISSQSSYLPEEQKGPGASR